MRGMVARIEGDTPVKSTLRATRNWGHVVGRLAVLVPISVAASRTPGQHWVTSWAMRQWCAGSCNGLGIQRELIHGERLARLPQCVFVANHLSQLDIIVLGSFLRRDYRWLAKAPLFKVPLLGWHLSAAGHIPVYRGADRHKNADLAERIHAVVEDGASLLFFPEATRSRDGHLKPFKIGAFMTAITEDLPVVPLVLRGTHDLMEPGSRDLNIRADRACSVSVLDAIHPLPGGEPKRRASLLRDAAYRAVYRELYARDGAPEGVQRPA